MEVQATGMTINLSVENEIRNSGKKGLQLYKKFISWKLPVTFFRVSINVKEEIPGVKKGRTVLFYQFNAKTEQQMDEIKTKLSNEKIQILGSLSDNNVYNVAIDINNFKA